MTANMTHSAFATNREFYIDGADPKISETLSRIFEADMTHEPIEITHPNLIISPIDARLKLERLLESAKKTILIYTEVFDDDALKNLLIKKAQENISVTIILTNPKKIAASQTFIDSLTPPGIHFFTPKKPTIHAKALIVDSSIAYVGSINFTKNSIENNREVGILFRDSGAL
jgi:phosphatidylserine/phosphatidylglycerophosphate/cardiolipin synthase-like enzyme